MASGHTRGPICFGSGTGVEHKKQLLPKALTALVMLIRFLIYLQKVGGMMFGQKKACFLEKSTSLPKISV